MTGRLAAREARSIPPLLYPRNLQILNAGHPRIGCLGFLYNAVASLWRMEKPVNERIQIIMLRLGMIIQVREFGESACRVGYLGRMSLPPETVLPGFGLPH